MSYILESGRDLQKTHEGMFIRLGRKSNDLKFPASKIFCYRLHRVWYDGINVRKYKSNPNVRPAFIPLAQLNQRVEVFTPEEFLKLPE